MSKDTVLVFVAAGGRGERLWDKYPEIRKSKLPKSLSILINGLPLVSYQLKGFLKIPNCLIVLSFNNQFSIEIFNKYLRSGMIPKGKYFLNVHPGDSDSKHVDMLRKSGPNKPWENQFKKIFITSGDVHIDSHHASNILAISDQFDCTVFTVAKFPYYQARLSSHYHLIIEDGNLLAIKRGKQLPNLALWHPYVFTRDVFGKYIKQPEGSSKPDFVSHLLLDGTKIKVSKPIYYSNINCPEDLENLKRLKNSEQ